MRGACIPSGKMGGKPTEEELGKRFAGQVVANDNDNHELVGWASFQKQTS